MACGRAATPAQAFEDLTENVHSLAHVQICGAENGRSVTENEIFHFFQKRRNLTSMWTEKAIRQKMEDRSLWAEFPSELWLAALGQ